MQLKIPPAIITFISGATMWLIDWYLTIDWLEVGRSFWIALAFLAIGGLFGLLGLIQFYNNSTSIDPHKPDKASHLVTDGIYSISRNPMYVGLVFYFSRLRILRGKPADAAGTSIVCGIYESLLNHPRRKSDGREVWG